MARPFGTPPDHKPKGPVTQSSEFWLGVLSVFVLIVVLVGGFQLFS